MCDLRKAEIPDLKRKSRKENAGKKTSAQTLHDSLTNIQTGIMHFLTQDLHHKHSLSC